MMPSLPDPAYGGLDLFQLLGRADEAFE